MFLKFELPFFRQYDQQTIHGLCRVMDVKHLEPGDILFMKGEACSHMFVIITGQIGVYTDSKF